MTNSSIPANSGIKLVPKVIKKMINSKEIRIDKNSSFSSDNLDDLAFNNDDTTTVREKSFYEENTMARKTSSVFEVSSDTR